MAVEVMVRISPRMYLEDAAALRSWLERRHPVEWTPRPDPDGGDALAAVDLVLTAVLAGVGEAAAKAAIDGIGEKIRELTRRYPATEPPPATVTAGRTGPAETAAETADAAQAADGEAPPAAAPVEPGGPGRDAH